MQKVNLTQGSQEWLAHRARHFNASDAPAMMGCSPYKTRTELLDELARGFAAEVDVATQKRFDNGHRVEALARPLAEEIIGEPLYQLVGTRGRLSASFDGLTVLEDVGFEHKALNADLVAAFADMETVNPTERERAAGKSLPLHHRVQMEQQLLVSGAERVLFMASSWDAESTLIEEHHCWYYPDPELRAQIVAGWQQFERDLAGHVPAAATVKPMGATPETLPALRIEVTGAVTASNFDAFRDHAMRVIGSIKRDLRTDQDFADAEATVKWCQGVEDKLAAAKASALAQTETIDALFRVVDDVSAEVRRARLELKKLVDAQKDAIRTEIVMQAQQQLRTHVAELNDSLPRGAVPVPAADFAGVIKGKRSVDSIRDAVGALVASAKVEATQTALRVRTNLDAFENLAAERLSLFPDLNALALKPAEDFAALVQGRLAQHAAEQKAAQERAAADAARREAVLQALREANAAAAAAEQQRQAEAGAKAALEAAAAPQIAPQTIPQKIPTAQPAAVHQTARTEPATLPLGKLCERLGFVVTAEFLAGLGFEAHRDRSARLYRESDFPAVCDALVAHIARQRQTFASTALAALI